MEHLINLLEHNSVKYLISVNYVLISFVKEQNYTLCEIASKPWNTDFVRYVRPEWQTKRVRDLSVKQSPYSIKYICDQTEDICLKAIRKNGFVLDYIKEENRTEAVCWEAVRRRGISICHVPERFVTREMEWLAIENSNGWAIMFVRDPTEAMCIAAVQLDGRVIKEIKDPTESMCIAAVRQDPLVIEDIDEKFVTGIVRLEAVRKEGFTLLHLDKKYWTETLCVEAVVHDEFIFQRIPRRFRTQPVVLAAVSAFPNLTEFLIEEERTLAVLEALLEQTKRRL